MTKRKKKYTTPTLRGPTHALETGDIGDFGEADDSSNPPNPPAPSRLSIPSRTRSLPVAATLVYRDPEIVGGSSVPDTKPTTSITSPLNQTAAFNVKPDSALRSGAKLVRGLYGVQRQKEVDLPNPLAPSDAQIERANQTAKAILAAKTASVNDKYALLRKRQAGSKTEDDN